MSVTNYYAVNGVVLGESGPNGIVNYHTDALGSVTMTSDQNGNIQNQYRYSPDGAQNYFDGSFQVPRFLWVGSLGYRHTGNVHSNTYVRARHYGYPEGMWTTVDPLWPDQSAFAYLDGKFINNADVSGRFAVSDDACSIPPAIDGKSQDNCPPAIITQLNDAQKWICSSSVQKLDPTAISNCAKAKMPSSCSKYNPPSMDAYKTCMLLFCNLNISSIVACPPSGHGCKKTTCSSNDCFIGKPGIPSSINICPHGYQCKKGTASPSSGCGTGSSNYGLSGFKSKGLPPFLQILLHELLHSCVTCHPGPPTDCDETYTQALTLCIIQQAL